MWPGHTFVVLEVEPFSAEEQKLEQPPFDGPELKFRFGRSRRGAHQLRYFRLSAVSPTRSGAPKIIDWVPWLCSPL
jgi:hypothetical protein